VTADPGLPDDAGLAAMAAALGRALIARGAKLAVAESCTGGWIAKALTDMAGSSEWFERGYVTYSNEAKVEALGVAPATLAAHGAVSEPVVAEMAAGARARAEVAAAIAVSGIAGPGGAMPGKPVGLVWFGFELDARRWTARAEFAGDREAVRRAAVAFALETLRAALDA
jgi:nicotinamide-nucleotide amidase